MSTLKTQFSIKEIESASTINEVIDLITKNPGDIDFIMDNSILGKPIYSIFKHNLLTNKDIISLIKLKHKFNEKEVTKEVRDEAINTLNNIGNDILLYKFIQENPEQVHLALIYSLNDAVTDSLIKLLIVEKYLDPYEESSEYFMLDEKNKNFLNYLIYLSENEPEEDYKEEYKDIYEEIIKFMFKI